MNVMAVVSLMAATSGWARKPQEAGNAGSSTTDRLLGFPEAEIALSERPSVIFIYF